MDDITAARGIAMMLKASGAVVDPDRGEPAFPGGGCATAVHEIC